MSRRKKKEYNGGGGSWLDTYADMITLLMTFFVMLYAMSSLDETKYNAMVESITSNMNPQQIEEFIENPEIIDGIIIPEIPLDLLYNTFKDYVEESDLEDSVTVNKTDNFVHISFSDEITFDGYSSALKPRGKEVMDELAIGLAKVDEHIEDILIQGHTALVSKNTKDPVGRRLSSDRANEVLLYIESKDVVPPEKFIAVGYGPHRPIADNSTGEGRAENRRVEMYITVTGYTIDATKIIKDVENIPDTSDK